jgi:spectrin beta
VFCRSKMRSNSSLSKKSWREKGRNQDWEQERLDQRKKLEIQKINDKRRQERPQYLELPEERMNGTAKPQEVEAEEEERRPIPTVRKTNSVVQTYERERIGLRRGSDSSVQRSSSMKVSTNVASNKPKRTPTFTTRRARLVQVEGATVRRFTTISFVFLKIAFQMGYLQPTRSRFLDRKHLQQAGAKRATNRTWKNSYTVLCGQLLCFFKNKDDFATSKASGSPINIHNAICSVADDYQKKKTHVPARPF